MLRTTFNKFKSFLSGSCNHDWYFIGNFIMTETNKVYSLENKISSLIECRSLIHSFKCKKCDDMRNERISKDITIPAIVQDHSDKKDGNVIYVNFRGCDL